MAFSGHGVGLEGSEKSQPARPETTSSDHHEAVVPEQVSATARMSTSKEEKLLKSPAKEEEGEDAGESTRERLKRHRREMAGKVWVPELWGQEKLLKDWMDCSAFDRPLVPAGLLTAPTPRASCSASPPLRVQNGCS